MRRRRANPTSLKASGPPADGPARIATSSSGLGADGRPDRPSYVSATLLGSCPFATPRSVMRQPRLIDAFDILPEIRHFMQDRLHVHLYRAPASGPSCGRYKESADPGPGPKPWSL